MKTRVVQEVPSDTGTPNGRRRNIAARMGHWSATHRKAAIWGWLAFVLLAVFIGRAVGQNTIHGADNFSGEAGTAEKALYGHGLRPNTEHVFFQSKTLTIRDPQYRAAVVDASTRLRHTKDVVNVVSPITGDAAVSADGHSALVDF